MPDSATIHAELAESANHAISLDAGEISQNLLTGAFRSLFRIEKEAEVTEPGVFQIDSAPANLDVKSMDLAHWRYFALSLLQENLRERRYASFNEYEFCLVLDVSRSISQGWETALQDRAGLPWRQHVLYTAKYLVYAFLRSALHGGYRCHVTLVDQGYQETLHLQDDENQVFAVLDFIDTYIDARSRAIEVPDDAPPWASVLGGLAERANPMLVAVISDFLDPLVHGTGEDELFALLGQLRYQHRLLVFQVNREEDINWPLGGMPTERELYHEEAGGRISLNPYEFQRLRAQMRDWLGGTGAEEEQGRFSQRMREMAITYRRCIAGESIRERIESLVANSI